MRIIAGEYRSRVLTAPRGMETRPTSDRLRETLFNVLAPRIAGARFTDLYAGSGAVGLEALSRGALHAHFAENAPPALTAIRENLKLLGIGRNFMIHERSALAALDRLQQQQSVQDIIFLDPPYDAPKEYEQVLGLLGSTASARLLAEDALVIAEHAKRTPLAERYGTLQRTRELKQGDAALSFYQRIVELPV
ncbi:MAG TPA: 16S rRNA (guanine(966)-N(2))-methyltransferase RsmD [Acidobacteriaceae bacterium]